MAQSVRRLSLHGSAGFANGQAVRIMKLGTMHGLEGGVIDTDWNGRVKVQLRSGHVRSYLPEELTHVNEESEVFEVMALAVEESKTAWDGEKAAGVEAVATMDGAGNNAGNKRRVDWQIPAVPGPE